MDRDAPQLRPGTVSAVQIQKRDAERVSVFIDGAFAFGLALDVAVRHGLRKGIVLGIEQQEALLAEEGMARARSAALDLIAHRPRTEAEVRRALARKGHAEEAVASAIDRMLDLGYLDDVAYARTFVAERSASRGHGPSRLRADLHRKGVPPAIIDQAIASGVDEVRVREAAFDVARRRWTRLASEPDPRKRRKRLGDFLARRGYDFELIREVTDALERQPAAASGKS